MKKFSFNMRKFKYGTASTLFTALFVAIVILFNVLSGFLTERFSWKIDLTDEGKFTLSEQTTELLSSLEDDVTIYILSTRAEMEKDVLSKGTLETIQRYTSASGGKVKYEFIDPNKNPKFFEKYPDARNSDKKALVIEGKDRYTVVQSSEFAYQYGETASNRTFYEGEEQISSAILYVSSEEINTAGFVVGHNETTPATLVNVFGGNSFNLLSVDIKDKVPENVNNLVISAPAVDFEAGEIANLEEFLSRDGSSLYLFWSANTPSLPVLERFLAEWGFAFEPYLVCDEKNSYTSEAVVIADVMKNEIIDTRSMGDLMALSPITRPIKLAFEGEEGYMRTVPLLKSSADSYGKLLSSDKTIKNYKKSSGDIPGPFVVASVTEKLIGSRGDQGISRIFVFGTDAFAADAVSQVARSFNNSILTQLVSYANDVQTLQIMPKVEVAYDLDITEDMIDGLKIVLLFVMPAVIFALGIYVFIRRKNK